MKKGRYLWANQNIHHKNQIHEMIVKTGYIFSQISNVTHSD